VMLMGMAASWRPVFYATPDAGVPGEVHAEGDAARLYADSGERASECGQAASDSIAKNSR
jgi:hypothetical protein